MEGTMPNYCINKNAQQNGDHEVHDVTPGVCHHLPQPENRIDLGWHSNCQSAVTEAKIRFSDHSSRINGCYYCSPACNTG